jgi:hypothetical protein
MIYLLTLTDGTEITYKANPSIREGTLLLFSLINKSLLASYSAGNWKSIVKVTDKGNS